METTKKICINCNKPFPIYNELQERNETEFCSGKCFIEYSKKEAIEKEDKDRKRNEVMNEIFNKFQHQTREYNIIIQCKECDLKLNLDLIQLKNPTIISNAVCSICQQKAEVIIEVVKQ